MIEKIIVQYRDERQKQEERVIDLIESVKQVSGMYEGKGHSFVMGALAELEGINYQVMCSTDVPIVDHMFSENHKVKAALFNARTRLIIATDKTDNPVMKIALRSLSDQCTIING